MKIRIYIIYNYELHKRSVKYKKNNLIHVFKFFLIYIYIYNLIILNYIYDLFLMIHPTLLRWHSYESHIYDYLFMKE